MSNIGKTVYISNNTCPIGSYCPGGALTPLACPPGTFNPSLALTSILQCMDCTPGQYCSHFNMSTTSGNCSGGFYCVVGAMTSFPLALIMSNYTHRVGGGAVCPKGNYCPPGSVQPLGCPVGTYANLPQVLTTPDLISIVQHRHQYYMWTPITFSVMFPHNFTRYLRKIDHFLRYFFIYLDI